jgi:Fic family protein
VNPRKGTYTATGLPGRLLAYFKANPQAELTRAQACHLFGVSRANVSMAFKKLADEGLLESVNVIRRPK